MTEKYLKELSIDKLFDLLIKTTGELKLTHRDDKNGIQVTKWKMLLLRRLMVAKRIENLH